VDQTRNLGYYKE